MKKAIAFKITYRCHELLKYLGKDPAALDNDHCRKVIRQCGAALTAASGWNSATTGMDVLEKHLKLLENWRIEEGRPADFCN